MRGEDPERIRATWDVAYRADWEHSNGEQFWRPSIFMPRWASRLTLEVTDVRVERLQDITEEDARAEGIRPFPFRPDDGFPVCYGYAVEDLKTNLFDPTAVRAYDRLWDSINLKRAPWDSNPWVWVVSFKRI